MNLSNHSESFLKNSGLLPQEEILEVQRNNKSFSIGIPKDDTGNEARIPLAPLAVKTLICEGFKVLLENNFASASNFTNLDYSEYGAIITDSKREIFHADIIIKIQPLSTEEIGMLKGNQILITSLNINSQPKEYFLKLLHKKVTCIAFDIMQDSQGRYPFVRSMSEIAGRSSILIAAEYLSNVHDGKGEMLGGITGVSPSEVVVIGAGTAGIYAAQTAYNLGALVKVFDDSLYNLDNLQRQLGAKVFTSAIHSKVLTTALKTADVVVGALRLINKMPKICVTEEMIMQMKKNSIIIDISIDQGGCFETSTITTHSNPVFKKHDVIHYCVPNIASRVARTATYSISNLLAQELLKLSKTGSLNSLLKSHPEVRTGVYIFNGILTNEHIGKLHGLFNKDIDLLLAAM